LAGVLAAPTTAALLMGAASHKEPARSESARSEPARRKPVPQHVAHAEPLLAGDAPAFLFASVQPIRAPAAWRKIYHQVERCAGRTGHYDAIRWAVMPRPLHGPNGSTFAFTVKQRIVLVQGDTTYLRHEMLHHILETSGWQPRPLQPGEHYSIADLHPQPFFGSCTGGR
jgi:hypothetical protein